MTPGTGRAPAKINLTLAVIGGPRPDGYHELRGVFARLDLADDLSAATRGSAPEAADPTTEAAHSAPEAVDSIVVTADSIPSDHPADLILRAAELVRAWADRPLPPLTFELTKRVPIAAGLAGGSSDGVAALRLAAAVWGLEVPPSALAELAFALGADAPFFLADSSLALVGGRGERVEPLPAGGVAGAGILLVVAGGKPSTGDVFATHDARDADGDAATDGVAATDLLVGSVSALDRAGLADLAPRLRDGNDLYPAAAELMPHLPPLRDRIEDVLGRPALLSGAGSTMFVIYPAVEAARDGRRRLEAALSDPNGDVPELIATAIAADPMRER